MAFVNVLQPEPIIECVPYNKDLPSISKTDADRGFICLHALEDTWIFPWKYRNVMLNIDKIYLPERHIGIISSVYSKIYPDLIEVKTQIVQMKRFPNGIKIRNGYGFLPYKIRAGTAVAVLHMIPVFECQPLTERNSP